MAAPLGEPALLVVLAILTGAVGGMGAVLFRLMVTAATYVFTTAVLGGATDPALRFWSGAAMPAIGLLLVGLISHRVAREVKGDGLPQVLEALALRGGRIRPRVGVFGILAPAITIGSGGSVGREGPIALIGAAFGSIMGQLLQMSDTYIALLLACGAAAGIGATFNAPLGGGLFGLEVVLGSWAMGALVPVFIASLTGVVVFDLIHGTQVVLPTPTYGFAHPDVVVLMLILGLLGGGVALAYARGLSLMEDVFDHHWRAAWYWKAALAGLAVGALGLVLPGVLRVGYGRIGIAAAGGYSLGILAALLLGKYVATLLTIGAGGSGGVFAPSLFLGAMLGGLFGAAVHAVVPALAPVPALFAVAGMGVVFSAAAQAPLTAMVIVLEMTGDYRLAAGIAGACVISYLVYGSLARDSMYTVRLSRRGVRVLRGAEVRPLQQVPITAAMQPLQVRLREDADIAATREALGASATGAVCVFRADGTLLGIADDAQVLHAQEDDLSGKTAGELCRRGVAVVSPDLSLDEAMRRFGMLTTDLLPVGSDAAHVIGTVNRADALRVYYQRTLLTLETQRKVALLRDHEEGPERGAFREVTMPAGWAGDGRTVAEMDLPPGVVVVSIGRGEGTVVPRGESALCSGDRVLLYAADGALADQAEGRLLQAAVRPRGIFGEVRLPVDWSGEGQSVAAVRPPAGAILVCVRRGGNLVIPHGGTVLQPGDVITVCAESVGVLRATRERLLTAQVPEPPPRGGAGG